LLGYQPSDEETFTSLEALRLAPRRAGEDRIEVTVPSWRIDLEREADLVEEVARHLGYDRIPTSSAGLPNVSAAGGPRTLSDRAKDIMAACGFQESFGYAMIAADEDVPFLPAGTAAPLALGNPIAESMSRLRRSLLPGLLRAADLNRRRGTKDVRLFETGHVFVPAAAGELPEEPRHLGLVWTGAALTRHWQGGDREVDLFDLFGVVDRLIHGLDPALATRREPDELPGFHPRRAARWVTGAGAVVARAGMLHPELQPSPSLAVFLAEANLEHLAAHPDAAPQYRPVPRLTAISRDLAVVMTSAVSYAEVQDVLRTVKSPAPSEFRAIDRYEGPPLEDGECALTVRVSIHPSERTLREEEIEEYRQRLIDAIANRLQLRIRT
jgi:phenylalanyl-tRNA synthetase beta chain